MPFSSSYIFFNSAVECRILRSTAEFRLETDIYEFITNLAHKDGWKVLRIDTVNQMGFPDMLLLRENTYWQIEAKRLTKKKLISIEDDLRWEFGQLSYMKRALTLNLNYMLAVSKGSNIVFIKGHGNGQQTANYPDFIG